MKKTIFGAALVSTLICGACSKNDNPATPQQPDKNAITFTTRIEALTRAPQLDQDGSGSFTPGDTFTLLAADKEAHSRTIDYSVGATVLYWNDLSFAQQGSTVDFAACYPTQKLDGTRFGFTLRQEAAGDLLLARTQGVEAGSQKPVALAFRHAMHRLVVKYSVTDSSVSASDIETSCTARNSCTVDLASGGIEPGESTDSFTARGETASLLLVPQAAKLVTLEIRAGEITKRCTLSELDSAPEMLEGGKILTVNLTIQNGTIRFDGLTIEGWGDQGSIDDEIIL